MPVEKSLPLAVVAGLSVGGLVYGFLLPDWYPALGVVAVYTGAAYFYLAFDVSLFGTHVEFTDRADRFGYGIGLFGLSVSPLALADYAGFREPATVGVVVWVVGMLAFLLLTTTAAHRA